MADLRGLSSSLNGLKVALRNNQGSGSLDFDSTQDELSEQDRQLVLEAELDQVRQVNDITEGVIGSLEVTEFNLDTVLTATQNANKLLDMWVRILSQTEHTQRLMFNPNWQGSTRDDELQAERDALIARQREHERLQREAREREAREREEERHRKQEILDEQRRAKEATLQRRGMMRTRSTRGAPASSSTVRRGGAVAGKTAAPRVSTSSTSTRGSRVPSSSRGGHQSTIPRFVGSGNPRQ